MKSLPLPRPAVPVTVALPATLTAPEPAMEIPCEAATVGDALLAVAQLPAVGKRVLFEEHVLVHVLLNGASLPASEAPGTRLRSGDRLDLLPPIAGG